MTVTTGLIGYALTGSVEVAGAIMTFDFFLKLILYYIHEEIMEQCPIKEMEIKFQCVIDTENSLFEPVPLEI